MLLAYAHCYGSESSRPELCLLADRPDQFSVPVRIESLIETDAAICRLGPQEAITVEIDEDGGWVISAVGAGKLFLTPNVTDRPGIIVKYLKIVKTGEKQYETYFLQEKDREKWRRWEPNAAIG